VSLPSRGGAYPARLLEVFPARRRKNSPMEHADPVQPGGHSVCPAAQGKWLATSWRRWLQKPEKILGGLIQPGETVADLGCGPGFFTLPMARLVGETGRVIAVDLQAGMLDLLRERAEKAGLTARIVLRQCTETDLQVHETVTFALAFYMVHEVPDVRAFLTQVHDILAPRGRFLLVEPVFHVPASAFEKTVEIAREVGLKPVAKPRIRLSRSVLLERD
jgi:SAM-dependent methyltransferase